MNDRAEFRFSSGQYRGYIYCGAKCLEKTAPAFSRPNALAHLNRRIRYWNKKKRLNIPLIEEQTHD
ncbi:hypothetical protein A4G19_15760 [Pasteurellaceae bacterium Macca]|nr:hypothetical protein [Pasteurellaceae bacterium Macca]MCK3656048.1 hypothetical protein [Pasteurellaceae bacterium Macca]MCK3656081.1 hypothetical protein [Pasteurellaceae bacterium Macca]MCK3656179.1 hypothetical protein [Pasteurellaceae bacterium Macca]MCK3656412.1 hypothetical protein [Pasteurellaceae bacterium Macca]